MESGWASRKPWFDEVMMLPSEAAVHPHAPEDGAVVDVSRPGEENITVSSIMLPAYPCGVGKKYMVEVSARSSAEKPAGRPVFTLFFDGEKKEIQRAEGSEFKSGISRARLVFSVDEPGFSGAAFGRAPDSAGPVLTGTAGGFLSSSLRRRSASL